MRKDTSSTLLAFSAATLMLLTSAVPLLSSSFLLQPAQAQTLESFRPVGQASGTDQNSGQELGLTFDAHGTPSTSDPSQVDITNGTIQLQADPGNNGQTYNGEITSGTFTNNTSEVDINFFATIDNSDYTVDSTCSSLANNTISLSNRYGETDFTGLVECTSSQGEGGNTTTADATMQPSSSMTAETAQDSDGDRDGIPDSSDRCAHNSNQRCFKEDTT